MKKVLVTIIALMFSVNVYANDIQLTDYEFAYGKRVYDGFSVVAYSPDRFYLKKNNNPAMEQRSYSKIQEGYLKPDGTLLYCSGDYQAAYGRSSDPLDNERVSFRQSPIGNIGVFDVDVPYNYEVLGLQTLTIFNPDGKIKYCGTNTDKIYELDGKVLNESEWREIVKADLITEESQNERVDHSYSFREKQINGQTYYALFKKLKDGETVADFMPTEQSTPRYSEYINQMYKKGLLFNNEMCFYKRGITRLDFGIVLGRAYCNATEYSIDRFTTDTHFVDVNNPYCLYLSDNGILTSSDALGYNLYLNEKEITKKVVSDALDKAAKKCGVLTEWNNIKVIQPTGAVCSRELAYVETFRLYDLIKQHNDPDYTAFQPSQVLDSDSEAETMHYETVSYETTPNKETSIEITTQAASNKETSTEITTQATVVNSGNKSKVTVISIIGSIIVVFAVIGAITKG